MDKVENLNSEMCAVSANPQLSVTYGPSFHNQITINEEPMLDYVLPKLDSSPSYYLVDTSISQSSSFPSSDVQYNPSISPSSGSVGDYQVSENLEMQLHQGRNIGFPIVFMCLQDDQYYFCYMKDEKEEYFMYLKASLYVIFLYEL